MTMPWWCTAQKGALNKSVPTLSPLRLYVADPPDFTHDFEEWCCAREQLWAIQKKLVDRVSLTN